MKYDVILCKFWVWFEMVGGELNPTVWGMWDRPPHIGPYVGPTSPHVGRQAPPGVVQVGREAPHRSLRVAVGLVIRHKI